MQLPHNVGQTDKMIRYGVALGALIIALMSTGTVATVAYIVATAAVVTATLGYCGLYSLLGISTCPTKKSK